MNWLGRSATAFYLIFLLASCEDPGEIGINSNNVNNLKVQFQNLEVPASNIFIDSLVTGQADVLLAGTYTDPVFGSVTSIGYVLARPNNFIVIPDSAFYDSLTFTIEYNYFYGIESQSPKKFQVFQLADTFKLSKGLFYGFDTIDIGRMVAEVEFELVDAQALPETETFRMDDTFGEELFQLAQDTSSNNIFENFGLFNEYFKGLAIMGDPSNNLLVGFDPGVNFTDEDTKITLHFHTVNVNGDTVTAEREFLFNTMPRFNQVITDRSGTTFESSFTQPYTAFDTGDGIAYMQGISGMFPKLDLSGVSNLVDTVGEIVISKAELVIGPIMPSDSLLAPPDEIRFYIVGDNNRLIPADGGFFPRSVQQESPVVLSNPFIGTNPLVVNYDPATNSYKADISLFTQNIVKGIYNDIQVYVFAENVSFTDPGFQPNISFANRFQLKKDSVSLRLFYSVPN